MIFIIQVIFLHRLEIAFWTSDVGIVIFSKWYAVQCTHELRLKPNVSMQ